MFSLNLLLQISDMSCCGESVNKYTQDLANYVFSFRCLNFIGEYNYSHCAIALRVSVYF